MDKAHCGITPFPKLGEIYRAIAVALDTKNNYREVDELARKGDFDWSLLIELKDSLISEPLNKYSDPEFSAFLKDWITHHHDCYIELFSTITVDSLSRKEVLSFLIEHYFSPQGLDLIVGIKRGYGGPDLMKLLDCELVPVKVVLDWLDEDEKQPLVQVAYPSATNDRVEKEKIRKWIAGEDLPKLQSIKQFSEKLKLSKSISIEKINNLKRWLIIARALTYLEQKSPLPCRDNMRIHLMRDLPDCNIQQVLSNAVIEKGRNMPELCSSAFNLQNDLNLTSKKSPDAKVKTEVELQRFEELFNKFDPDGNTRYHLEWLYAKWHMNSGNFKDACEFYEKAVTSASYRAGSQQKFIIEQALVLAAHLGEKAFLKRIKHQAVAHGLFNKPSNEVIEEWEINQLKDKFLNIFPVIGRFKEFPSDTAETSPLPILWFDENAISKKPDLRNPDRVIKQSAIDGQTRRYSQLRYFAASNHFDHVKSLLDAGASVNHLDDDGASALLCSIQQAKRTGDHKVLNLLLEQPHSTTVLNSSITKKKLTPLLCAIELGEPEIVEKLLRMGARPDERENIVDETPLYKVMELLLKIRNPQKMQQITSKQLSSEPDITMKDVFRRYNISNTGVFGDGREHIKKYLNQPDGLNKLNNLISEIIKNETKGHTNAKLIRIIELLLEYGANPNSPRDYPVPGRTPLMLAAENDFEDIFALLIGARGDPYIKDKQGLDCRQIARNFESNKVIRLMRDKRIL